MIRVIRNTKSNKVVALQVNGKKYSVSRELGYALSQEENANLEESKKLVEKAKATHQCINNKSYFGDSSKLKLKVSFDEMNRIESKKTVVEFKEGVDSNSKEIFLNLIEDFILSVNRAQYKRHLDYCSSVKDLTNKKQSA